MTKTLISIVGPTAIGKTALSIKLAQCFDTDIVSADSRQFFKEMNIGTAVPSLEELNTATHYFIQHKSITEPYSVGDFERDSIRQIKTIHQENPYAIMVGGSGLYVKAVTNGLDDFPDVDSSIREKLNSELAQNGLKSLQDQLEALDPKSYNTIAIYNPQRLLRALEICLGTGKPYSSFYRNKSKRDGHESYCKECAKHRNLLKRIKNKINVWAKTDCMPRRIKQNRGRQKELSQKYNFFRCLFSPLGLLLFSLRGKTLCGCPCAWLFSRPSCSC